MPERDFNWQDVLNGSLLYLAIFLFLLKTAP